MDKIIIPNILNPESALLFLGGLPIIPEKIGALPKSDIIIVADSGLNNALLMNFTPDIIVGDMDSIDKSLLEKYKTSSIVFLDGPNDQDACDSEKALRIAVRTGIKKIIIVTAGGGRLDHQLAIFAILFNPNLRKIQVEIRWDSSQAFALQGPSEIYLDLPPETTIGLIPFGGDARGVSTNGLKWPLQNEDLTVYSSRGVSNVTYKERIEVSIVSGCLLLTIENNYNYMG